MKKKATDKSAKTAASAPLKQIKKANRKPRHSNHKTRSIWFQARSSWPVREAPIHKLVQQRAIARKTLAPQPGETQWESVGPTNVGGRMTSIVCHPSRPDTIWIGAAGGGVWKSADAGRTWRALWHDQDVLSVGSLAVDPKDPKTVYCGTGEANLSADAYPGVGIYRTKNGGRKWVLLASSAKTGIPRRIGVIALDPFDSKHLVIGGVGYSEDERGGMSTSRDGGVSWTRESFISPFNYWCHSIAFHPTQRGTIYATFTARGVKNGIWKTTDDGKTWTQLTKGLPMPARLGRTTVAIAPSSPDVVYAYADDGNEAVLGVFRSANGGANWTDVSGTHFQKEGQSSYNNTIAVHPTSPNHVICGGVDLHLSTDGGKNWRKVTRWNADRGNSDYAHADHHNLLMPAAAPGRIYDPNDGGLDVSEDGGLRWTNRSNGLAATMYYDLDVAATSGKFFGGGTQDNGTVVTETGGSDDHTEKLGGDGGWMVYDPTDETHLYASYYNFNIFRFHGKSARYVTPASASDAERESVWMVYILMDPSNPNTVFTGTHRVWRTQNDGLSWKAVSGTLDGSDITAIEIAPKNTKRIYIGTENGGFFRSLDGGETWSPNLASATLPGVTITRIESSPVNADVIFATVANFGHSHVFRSNDGGLNWADVDSGVLPDVPHHALAIPGDAPNSVYAANDAGVFVSPDLGTTWRDISRNLPNVPVVDLVYHEKDGALTAATYGRSLWRLKVR